MAEIDEKTLQAALAGLLHDIGKFAQRTEVRSRESIDRRTQADVKYAHAMASYEFAEEVTQNLPADLRKQVLNGVAYHHAPQTELGELIQLADWLAAGERDEPRDVREATSVSLMRSIFSRVYHLDEPWYVPLSRLQFSKDALFPVKLDTADPRTDYQKRYETLWQEFREACAPLKSTADPVVFLETLYNRMLEFTWCVPGAYSHAIPDVSLFDHCRMTAAVAACLAIDGRDGNWCREVQDDTPTALLVAGDVNGVQDFIYTLASSGAAKTLRGRSFYVQLLTEVVAEFVLCELGLPITNLIYAGGGNFYLLVGVTQAERLAELRRAVIQRLITAHRGDLYLTLAWTSVKRAEFQCGRFVEAWQRLHESELLPQKHRPLAALPAQEIFAQVGAPQGTGGDNDRTCSVCGAEQQEGERFETETVGAETVRKCALCQSLEELGKQLAAATHMVWLRTPPPAQASEVHAWQTGLENFGARIALINAREAAVKDTISVRLDGATLARISSVGKHADDGVLRTALQGLPTVNVIRPLAQLVPRDRYGYPITFDDLAELSESGLKRWGVLRMDVDNLGLLFRKGFRGREGDNLTLSRLASLSLSLRLFFEGVLPQLAAPQDEKDNADLHKYLYLQYAGGDDLFVVGTWQALPRFAWRIRSGFADFVCHNSDVTLSAGISLADKRYPLYQAARDADKAEKDAKGLRERKDAITFLGHPLGWEDFGDVMERAEQLAEWVDKRNAPKALLQTLIEIAAEYARNNKAGKLHFGRWMWVLAYQLTRAALHTKDPEVREGIVAMRNELLSSRTLVRTIGLSARWAELLTRKG